MGDELSHGQAKVDTHTEQTMTIPVGQRASGNTRPTLECQNTLGHLRSINPNMINHFVNQSQTCQLLIFLHWKETVKSGVISGWTDKYQLQNWSSHSSSRINHLHQVEAQAELWGWQGFRSWAQIRSHAETTNHSQKLASALVCRWRRSGHVTRSLAWLIPHIFKNNRNQHAFNIKYLASLIKNYWICFRYQKLADFLVCFPPSVRVQVWWPPSLKICLRIQLSFGFWDRAVKAFYNFSRKLAWLLKTIF